MAAKKRNPETKEPPAPGEDARSKVFLSYSRANTSAMQNIAAAMLAQGEFLPDFDKADHDPDRVAAGIRADEPWWQRLEEMIAGAETMVLLVSPASAASRVVDEEIAYAQRLGKRIVPVLVEPVDFAALPPKLASLNIAIDFTASGPGFDAAFAQLIQVLKVNAAWLREGRKYYEMTLENEGEVCPSGEPGEGENTCRMYSDRMVTQADAAAYPGIRHRIGQDACAAILNPSPWWHALAFWRQR